MKPRYIRLYESGELASRSAALKRQYVDCALCPHQCHVDRTRGERGRCRSGSRAVVASANIHTGEEPPISGKRGSGTVFLSGCTGKCLFCQNYPISQLQTGNEVSDEHLADMMLDLQRRGVHNINFVTPTHFAPSIVSAIALAVPQGLNIPIVYNTSGYERKEILRLLDGIIDIYLPDAKYGDNDIARQISGFDDYVGYNRKALIEMYRQVGRFRERNGAGTSGMIVRHLILPDGMSGTDDVMAFLATAISPDIHVSLMGQYFPAHSALQHERLARRITAEEYDNSVSSFFASGLHNGWIQDHFFV